MLFVLSALIIIKITVDYLNNRVNIRLSKIRPAQFKIFVFDNANVYIFDFDFEAKLPLLTLITAYFIFYPPLIICDIAPAL